MKKLAALGLAGLMAAGTLTLPTASEAAPRRALAWGAGAFIAGTVIGLAAAAASQPHYYYEPYPVYQPYYAPRAYYYPQPVYVAPQPRVVYRTYSYNHCKQYFGYNSYTGIVTEANGNSWQCSPPRR